MRASATILTVKRSSNYVLFAILLLAFGLRLYRIDAQSLWNDEGTSVVLAGRGLAAITRGAAGDIHPPFYYYVLHYWLKFAGTTEFAARAFSAFSGTLLVLFTFVIARRTTTIPVAFGAALLSAVSPFQIYYSQETRTYIFTALLAALSIYFFIKLLRSPSTMLRPSRAIPYLLSSIALIYTHYFAITIIFVENAVFVITKARSGTKGTKLHAFTVWGVLQLIIVAAYVPWLRIAQNLQTWPAISEPQSFPTLLQNLLTVFSLGLSISPEKSWLAYIFAAPLLLGILSALARLRTTPYSLLLSYLLIPILTMYALSFSRPMYNPKFLLLATPPFYILVAYGAVQMGKWANGQVGKWANGQMGKWANGQMGKWANGQMGKFAYLLICLFVSGYSLRNYYYDPQYARDNYRGIVEYVSATAREDDAVLINAPGQQEVFRYYYKGNLAVYPLPQYRPLQEKSTRRTLERIAAEHDRIYAVLWATDESDPQRLIEGWLDDHAYKASDWWYGNVRLVIYATAVTEGDTTQQYPLDVTFGENIKLLGYNLSTADQPLSAGEILQLTLFWQATAPVTERYKVFVHVLDQRNHIVGQHDAEPGGGTRLTTLWQPGEIITDNHGVLILPATPPGTHQIEIGMYNLTSGARLTVSDVDESRVLLSPIEIDAGGRYGDNALDIAGLNIQYPLERYPPFDPLTLLGYDQYKLGHDHDRATPLHPGDILHLTLYWQYRGYGDNVLADASFGLQLHKGNALITGWPITLTEGLYPPSTWPRGAVVRDQHHLPLPPDISPGEYHLTVQMRLYRHKIPALPLAPFRVE